MKQYYERLARTYLSSRGYSSDKIKEILTGFDLEKATYEQRLDQRTIIYQFVRRSSQSNIMPKLGNWFCLPGASQSRLAIIGGGEGRQIAKIRVEVPLLALEGTASPQSINWDWSGGGEGGATQIFIPDQYLMSNIRVLGYTTTFAHSAGA